MRKENSAVRTKFISEAGSRLVNADYFAFVELDNYACYCIADGIDNDRMKESARLAVSSVIDEFYQRPGIGKGTIKRYLEAAHRTLLKESGTVRLEASVLVIVTDYKKMRYGNAGNARMYHWRNGKIINQSKDQSLSRNLADKGDIALDKIEEHEERHNLYCYAGQRGSFRPEISKKVKMADGDILSLMTCGIWENTGVAELLDSIEDAKSPEEVCSGMEEIILSQRLKNIQNYTFSCIYIDKVYRNPNKQRNMKIVKRILIPLCIALFILGIGFTIKTVILYKNINSMWNCIDLAVEDMAAGLDEEGNNSYDKANDIYKKFDSRSELSKNKVIAAKTYMNLFEYRDEYLKAENCQERYEAACKLLTCLVGSKEFQRLENDGIDDKALALSSLKRVSTKYLDGAAKADLKNFSEAFLKEYDKLKVEYNVYQLLKETQTLFETQINDASKENELVQAAKAAGIIIYNFDGSQFSDKYKDLKTAVAYASNNNIKLSTTEEQYNEFLNNVSSRLAYIKGRAYESEAEGLVNAGQFPEAKTAYNNAKDALQKAGKETYAGDISDIEGKIAGVDQKVSDANMDKLNEDTRLLVAQAAEKFDSARYDEAQNICSQVSSMLSQAGISSGIVYDDLCKLQEKIVSAQNASGYEKEAQEYEIQGDYDMAVSTYEYAQKAYEEAGVNDKEKEMRQKINGIKKILSEQETTVAGTN